MDCSHRMWYEYEILFNLVNSQMKNAIFKFCFIASFITFTIMANIASAQAGCTTSGAYFQNSGGRILVGFTGFHPLRLRSQRGCALSESCVFELSLVAGNQLSRQISDVRITNICSSISTKVERYKRTRGTNKQKEFRFSRKARILIPYDGGTIVLERTDFSDAPESIGWQTPLTEVGRSISYVYAGMSEYNVLVQSK